MLINKFSQIDSYGLASNFTVDISLIFFHMMAIILSVKALTGKLSALSIPLIIFAIFTLFIADPWIEIYGYSRSAAPLFLFLITHYIATGDQIVLVPVFGSLFSLFLFLKCAAVIP